MPPCMSKHHSDATRNAVGVVSRLIGHSRTSTTTDVYLEVLSKEIFEIRDKLPSLNLPLAENQ